MKTSAPIGVWEVKLEIMTDRQQTDMGVHREATLPIRVGDLHYVLIIISGNKCLGGKGKAH